MDIARLDYTVATVPIYFRHLEPRTELLECAIGEVRGPMEIQRPVKRTIHRHRAFNGRRLFQHLCGRTRPLYLAMCLVL